MTEEMIITGLEVTTGEAPDGLYLEKIAEQSKENGINGSYPKKVKMLIKTPTKF